MYNKNILCCLVVVWSAVAVATAVAREIYRTV